MVATGPHMFLSLREVRYVSPETDRIESLTS